MTTVSTKVKSWVAHSHFIIKVCDDESSWVRTFNMGWAHRISLNLKEEGNLWILSADCSGGSDAPVATQEIARFRDQKAAQKAFCKVTRGLRCSGTSLWRTLAKTALLTAAAVLVVALMYVGLMMGGRAILKTALGPMPMLSGTRAGAAVDPATQKILSELAQTRAQRASAAVGSLPAAVTTPKTSSSPYGVPLSADEVLEAK